jgi:polar amino acid transport system substrate-binding protein
MRFILALPAAGRSYPVPFDRGVYMLRFALLLVASVAFGSGVVMAEQEVRLMASTSPPYADAKLPEQGLALELVRHIYAGTDYTPVITIESWSRAVEGALLGVYDGLASVWYSDARNKDLLFSEPYLRSELLILKRRSDRGNYFKLEHLAGSRLGVRVDYAYGVDFAAIPDLTLVQENHMIQSLLNLLNGSVDFVIGDQRTITLQLHEYLADKITQFEVVPIVLPHVERHVAASRSLPGHEKMIAEFNRALAATRKDGSHDAIVKKWDARYGGIE